MILQRALQNSFFVVRIDFEFMGNLQIQYKYSRSWNRTYHIHPNSA